MKRKILLIPLTVFSLIGCNKNENKNGKVYLNTGSLIDNEATKILFTDLKGMIYDKNSFLLAVYPGEKSSCGCWLNFSDNLNSFVKENKEIVYKINYGLLEDNRESFGLDYLSDRPTFAIFKDGKLHKQWVYNKAGDDQDLFTSKTYFKNLVNKYTVAPKVLFLDQTMLDEKIKTDEFVVMYEWKSCPDCTYCLPNAVYPYFKKGNNKDKKDIYIIDLQIKGLLLDEEGNYAPNNENYINFKNEHGLSKKGNEDFGYNNGYVPTFQYYKNGKLESSSVYFNDVIGYNEQTSTYFIEDTFYTNERSSKLRYLDDFEGEKSLLGLNIPSEQLNINSETNKASWKKEYAEIVHNPYLYAFFDYYL